MDELRYRLLLETLKRCYQKHHLDDPDIGWDELSNEMQITLCEVMGDEAFRHWLIEQEDKKL